MIEEVKTDNNCIIRAFENNPISILEEDIDNKRIYYFKASDIGKALNLSNIRVSIQHYDEDEQVVRKAYDLRGCEQDTIFLTSGGVYRLLYNSKKEIEIFSGLNVTKKMNAGKKNGYSVFIGLKIKLDCI